jgi:hypothetical protein
MLFRELIAIALCLRNPQHITCNFVLHFQNVPLVASLQLDIVFTLNVIKRLTMVRTCPRHHQLYVKPTARFQYKITRINIKLLKLFMGII